MYRESKQYLIAKLQSAGILNPYTSEKALEKCQDSHVGAVLFESEGLSRNGSKTIYTDTEGARQKRRKVFDRKLTFTVVIGDYSDDAVEAMYETFIASLDRGITVNGNYIPIETDGADWVEKDDSILKAKVAVQVKITFDGGIYRDTGFAPLSRVELIGVEKGVENEKSDSSGGGANG